MSHDDFDALDVERAYDNLDKVREEVATLRARVAEKEFATALGEYVSLVEDRAAGCKVPSFKLLVAAGRVHQLFQSAHEENQRLREALMPLAAVSMQAVDLGQDLKYSVLWRFTEDQVRAARKALAGGKGEG